MSDKNQLRNVRLFLSSPGDLSTERAQVHELVGRLNKSVFLRLGLHLEVVAYDDPDAPVPLSLGATPQDDVNRYKGQPADCELTVGILWSRLGTPLPADIVRGDGSRYESGTVWEIENAERAGRTVWLYRCARVPQIALDDPLFDDKRAAYAAVGRYLSRCTNPDKSIRGGVNSFSTQDEFVALLEQHLIEHFVRQYPVPDADQAVGGSINSIDSLANNQMRIHYANGQYRDVPYLIGMPAPAHGVVGRNQLLEEIWSHIERTPMQPKALMVTPGVGKTTVAFELASDMRRVLDSYDGLLWANLGRQPDVNCELEAWANALGIPEQQRREIIDWKQSIKNAIGNQRLLIILDDVWHPENAQEFMALGSHCCYLLTTRKLSIALEQTEVQIVVAELDEEAGLQLLESIAPKAVAFDRLRAQALVRSVGGLPHSLVLIGKYLRNESYSDNPRRIRNAFNRYPVDTQLADLDVVEVSYDALPNDTVRHTLLRLSILRPKPHAFCENVVQSICGGSIEEFDLLYDSGLIESEKDDTGNVLYTMHRIVSDFARSRQHELHEDPVFLHYKALAFYTERLSNPDGIDPFSYLAWYRYEHPDWQYYMDAWLYHLSHTGARREALIAFLKVYFDAFWWWGVYEEFPYCERLIRDWQLRNVEEAAKEGLDQLARFQAAYQRLNDRDEPGEWQTVRNALMAIRRSAGLEGDPLVFDDVDARHVRGFIDFFIAEACAELGEDYASVVADYDEVVKIFLFDNNQWVACWIEWYIAQHLFESGEYAEALLRCQRAWALAREEQPLEQIDAEILANIYRLRCDIALADSDYAHVPSYALHAAYYAYIFQAYPEPADAYTISFYREITEKIAQAVLQLQRYNPALAQACAQNIQKFFAAARALHLNRAAPDEPIILADVQCDYLISMLFPPGIASAEIGQQAHAYQALVIEAIEQGLSIAALSP